MFRTKYMLMDQVNSTEGASSGYGTGQANTADTKVTETPGGGGTTPAATSGANTEGTPNAEGKTPESQQTKTPEEQQNVTGYSTDDPAPEEKKAEETKPEENKPDTKVEDFKLDLKGLSEEQTKDIVEFSKELKLTKEQAQAILDKRKSELDKYIDFQTTEANTIKETHKKWEGDLRTDWGEEFKPNVHAVNNTLSKHFPTIAKHLATTGKRLNPLEMKEFLAVSKLLSDEGTFENGEANMQSKMRHPSDYYTN